MKRSKLFSTKNRFDLVIANTDRCEAFWEAFDSLKNFDSKHDRIIFMDCSVNPHRELTKCLKFIKQLGLQSAQFYFLKRRNWNLNHGAQLDYVRLICENKLEKPKYTYFMQEHYLNKKILIKGDSIPSNEIIDLDEIERLLLHNQNTVFFCARNGFRVSSGVADIKGFLKYKGKKDINTLHLKDSIDISFEIDGGNFCLDISHYMNHYKKNKNIYTDGNGCIHFCGAWEVRLSKILYDQGMLFFEKHRNIQFQTINQMKTKYPDPGNIWSYVYLRPQANFLYGKDLFPYPFKFCREYIEEIIKFIYFNVTCDRNPGIQCLYPVEK